MDIKTFLRDLPKAELHLHIEGAIPWNLVRKHSKYPLPSTPKWWNDTFLFYDFSSDFKDALKTCYLPVLRDAELYYQSAHEIFANLVEHNVRYVEITFSLHHAIDQGISLKDIVSAIKSAVPSNLIAVIYGGLSRKRPNADQNEFIQSAFDQHILDGLDLHGDERLSSASSFSTLYRRAKTEGLYVKAHAGELCGAYSVYEAINQLGVKRIEHGVTSFQDPALILDLVEQGITLDMCLTSNYKLRVVESIEQHPIQTLYRHGIAVTISTDDPTIFGCTLNTELELLSHKLGFSLTDIANLQMNAFRTAAIPQQTYDALTAEIAQLIQSTNTS